jgi:hypothetical protein
MKKKAKTAIKTGIIAITIWAGIALHLYMNKGKRHEV